MSSRMVTVYLPVLQINAFDIALFDWRLDLIYREIRMSMLTLALNPQSAAVYSRPGTDHHERRLATLT